MGVFRLQAAFDLQGTRGAPVVLDAGVILWRSASESERE